MDWLEDFFIRHQLLENAIEITEITEKSIRTGKIQRSTQDYLAQKSIHETAMIVEEVGVLEQQFAALKKRLYTTRKISRKATRTVLNMQSRQQVSLIRQAKWIEWVLVPLAIGQFWWLAMLSLPALSTQAQCEDHVSRNLVQVSIEFLTTSFKLNS